MQTEDQSALIAALEKPETWGVDGPVERLTTHISELFLTKDRVYKLKRAVRFSYLDFSDQAKRRAAAEAELTLNRRTAPDIYLGIEPVRLGSDGYRVGVGEGNVVDWLVVMRRFDEADRLDRVAGRGKLDRHMCEDIAVAVAQLHAEAAVVNEGGGAEGLRYVVDSSRQWALDTPPGVLDQGAVSALFDRLDQAVDKQAALLDRRRDHGKVRRCHGDLHLANLCLWKGKPTPFDAIEFNDRIATVDVLYDLAFLVMDLDHRGHRRLANILFNRYLDLTGDVDGLAAMPLFMALRAMVRAMASATTGDSEAAQAYLTRAADYLDPAPPVLLAVGGLSGSGKSRMGRELAPDMGRAPGARVVRTDIVRKRLMGKGPLEPLGTEGYTAEMAELTYQAFWAEIRTALQAGQAAVADAVFAQEPQRHAARELARMVAVPFVGLWLDAPVAVRKERVEHRKRNPSDATAEVLDRQLTYDLGDLDWPQIDTSGPREKTLVAGRRHLADTR